MRSIVGVRRRPTQSSTGCSAEVADPISGSGQGDGVAHGREDMAHVTEPSDAVALLTAGIDALAATDPGGLTAAVVAEQLTTLDHLANRLDAQVVRLLGVFDVRDGMAVTPATTPHRRGRHRRE